MKYLILTVPDINYAKAISNFLWSIQANKDKSTIYYNHWVVHPINGNVALAFPNDKILLDSQADATLLVNQVRQAITKDEAVAMENRINQGGLVTPLNFIPDSLGDNIKKYKEMESDGWFPENN